MMWAIIVLCSTNIAESSSTQASHLITSLSSRNPPLTSWAFLAWGLLYILIKFNIFFQILLLLLTGHSLMPFLVTFLAKTQLTSITIECPISIVLKHKVIAVHDWANIDIIDVLFHKHLDLNVLESLVFLLTSYLFHLGINNLVLAFMVRTLNWELSLTNRTADEGLDTIDVISVITFSFTWNKDRTLIMQVIIADWTCSKD